jgi:hypothetical protein
MALLPVPAFIIALRSLYVSADGKAGKPGQGARDRCDGLGFVCIFSGAKTAFLLDAAVISSKVASS